MLAILLVASAEEEVRSSEIPCAILRLVLEDLRGAEVLLSLSKVVASAPRAERVTASTCWQS